MRELPEKDIFRSWCQRVSQLASDQADSEVLKHVERLGAAYVSGEDPKHLCDELNNLFERNSAHGTMIMAALCQAYPDEFHFLSYAVSFFLGLFQASENAPLETYERGLSALNCLYGLTPLGLGGGEYLFFFSKFAPDRLEKVSLLETARYRLSNAIQTAPDASLINRERAFLAHTLLDLGLEADLEDAKILFEASKVIEKIPAAARFAFLDLVEGQICLALADHFENDESRKYAGRAADCFSSALEHSPGDKEATLGTVGTLILMADQTAGQEAENLLDRALSYARKYTVDNPHSSHGHCALGNIASIRANFTEGQRRFALIQKACSYFEAALACDSDDINALQGLGNQAISLAERPLLSDWKKQVEAGKKAFEKSLKIAPGNFNAKYGLATICRFMMRSADGTELQSFKQATSLLEDITKQYPERNSGFIALGQVLRESVYFKIDDGSGEAERLKKAMDAYRTAEELAPRDIYTKISILNLEIDFLAELQTKEKVLQKAETLIADLQKIHIIDGKTRTTVHSFIALLGKVDQILHSIKEMFPTDFISRYAPDIRSMIGKSEELYDGEDLSNFEFGAKSEFLTGLEAYACLERGKPDQAISILTKETAKFFRKQVPEQSGQIFPTDQTVPYVYLSVTGREAFAIINFQGGLTTIRLPDLPRDLLMSCLVDLDRFMIEERNKPEAEHRYSGSDSTSYSAPNDWNKAIMEFLSWIGSGFKPLLDFMDELDVQKICWVPQGLWSLCPLHAVLRSDGRALFQDYGNEYVFPLNPRRKYSSQPIANHSVIAFVNPDYDKESKLSSGPIETKFFSSMDQQNGLNVEVIDAERATAEHFLKLNEENLDKAILHLSCHGSGAQIDPRSCRLFFSNDETVELPEILRKSEFGGAGLVFLSACESGLRSRYVIDEAVSLNSAFLFLGAGNTITSLWMVSDFLSAEFSRLFYTSLSELGDIHLCYRNACVTMKETYGDNAVHIWSGYQLWTSMS